MDVIFWGLSVRQWLDVGISALILLLVLLLGRIIISFLIDKVLLRITKKTKNTLDNQILQAIRLPAYLLAIVLALNTSLARLNFLPEDWDRWVSTKDF